MIDRFMNPSLTFMFVRDPYSRLFSAYVDKLVSPNCDYWKGIGALGMQLFRTNANDMNKKCGHDMTFREFVKTVIYSEEHLPFSELNVHFTPIFQHCDPCRYRWYVIGKMETFESDVFYLLDRMARTDITRSLEETFHAQYLHYTIRDQCNWLYHFRKRYRSDCNMTFYEAQKKLWRHFKIRGILRRQIPFPISPADSGRISKNKLIQIIYNAMGNTNDRLDAMRNRKQAFLEAYSTIDMDDLFKLSKIFHADCEIFGYDCKPGDIFDRKGRKLKHLFFV
ncbi:carbohydrate sulfotransferase 12-like [Argopecten irradians]|uniref:carbohydrate sulfotransferase 12-like n=1 Tax=Argopecten irradians TaxID=31199 RepID=UPI003717D657